MEGDARKAARERSGDLARRSDVLNVACAPGAGDGSRGHVVCLGRGCRPACLGHFKRKLSAIIGGLRWKGPFQSKELTSRETATRDVVVTESGKAISWCLFDGQTFEEVQLECHGSLLGVVASERAARRSSIVYLVYEGGTWQSLQDGKAVKGGKFTKAIESVCGSVHAGYVASCSDGKTRVLQTTKTTVKLGKVLLDDACDCIHVSKAPASLWARSSTSSSPESEGWHASTKFDERSFLYGAPVLDAKQEKLSLVETVVGVASDGALIASSIKVTTARALRASDGGLCYARFGRRRRRHT